MKFSQENLDAVEDRICDYANALESGTTHIKKCLVCATSTIPDSDPKMEGRNLRDCSLCVLDGQCERATKWHAGCITKSRGQIRETWTVTDFYKVANNPKWLKIRLKELQDHVKKRLEE